MRLKKSKNNSLRKTLLTPMISTMILQSSKMNQLNNNKMQMMCLEIHISYTWMILMILGGSKNLISKPMLKALFKVWKKYFMSAGLLDLIILSLWIIRPLEWYYCRQKSSNYAIIENGNKRCPKKMRQKYKSCLKEH